MKERGKPDGKSSANPVASARGIIKQEAKYALDIFNVRFVLTPEKKNAESVQIPNVPITRDGPAKIVVKSRLKVS